MYTQRLSGIVGSDSWFGWQVQSAGRARWNLGGQGRLTRISIIGVEPSLLPTSTMAIVHKACI